MRSKAEKKARKLGLSLQDIVRLVLHKYADDKLEVSVQEPGAVRLSPRAIRRYNRILKDIEEGKNIYSAKDVDDLMRQLHEG